VVVYLAKAQILHVHERLIERFGGPSGLRSEGALESAIARPQATFEGEDLHPSLAAKASALFHSLVTNHPFVDGNKRVAALAMELFLLVNGSELVATDDELEEITVATASGRREAEEIAIWIEQRLRPLS
jgi:death-on-curing protein